MSLGKSFAFREKLSKIDMELRPWSRSSKDIYVAKGQRVLVSSLKVVPASVLALVSVDEITLRGRYRT